MTRGTVLRLLLIAALTGVLMIFAATKVDFVYTGF